LPDEAPAFTAHEPMPSFELSSSQKGIYILESLGLTGTTYNIPLVLDIKGPLDRTRLNQALDKVIKRHASLRTYFEMHGHQAVQRVAGALHLKNTMHATQEDELEERIKAVAQPFDLAKPPLIHTALHEISKERHVLVFDVHHAIFDGMSMRVFLNDLAGFYRGEELPDPAYQYQDYVLWQKEFLNGPAGNKQRDYWLDRLDGELPVLDLPSDYPRPPVLDYDGERLHHDLRPGLSRKISRFAHQSEASPNMVLMAAFFLLLSKYSNQQEIIVGSGVSGRSMPETHDMIGMFVNTLPIRCRPEKQISFMELLGRVKRAMIGALDNQDYPLEKIVDDLGITRDMGRNPLFDVVFMFQSMGFSGVEADGISMEPRVKFLQNSHFDLLLEAVEIQDDLRLSWEYRTSLFSEGFIHAMAGHYEQLLLEVTADPEKNLGSYQMLTKHEEQLLTEAYNHTGAEYLDEATVADLFEEAAARFPERTAVVMWDESLSYAELNARANQLAGFLRAKGVKRETIVGLMTGRRAELIIGILGIVKAGGCYLPIKPEFPKDRIEFMLADSQAPILLTTPDLMDQVPGFGGEVCDFLNPVIYQGGEENPQPVNQPGDRLYIIYTSGSTGRPKGVVLQHYNIVRLMKNSHYGDPDYYSFSEHDVWTMFHSFCFDFSVWEMYGALLYGGKLVMVPGSAAMDPDAFLQILRDEGVTVLNQTPGSF
jgi:non-ribosomal peptide synthetase component F